MQIGTALAGQRADLVVFYYGIVVRCARSRPAGGICYFVIPADAAHCRRSSRRRVAEISSASSFSSGKAVKYCRTTTLFGRLSVA